MHGLQADATEPAGQAEEAAPAAPADSQPAPAQPSAIESLPASKAKTDRDSGPAAKVHNKLKPGKGQSVSARAAQKSLPGRVDDEQLADESSDESEDEQAEADIRWARMR